MNDNPLMLSSAFAGFQPESRDSAFAAVLGRRKYSDSAATCVYTEANSKAISCPANAVEVMKRKQENEDEVESPKKM